MSEPEVYAMGRTLAETRRLVLQHQVYGPLTRRLFVAAGIGPGMKVLDVGSGAGDVALLAADLVGASGLVLGIDMNPTILETARERAVLAGWTNVGFQAADLREFTTNFAFDAVVGRFVLMYQEDPTAIVRRLAKFLRPGGIVAFHELDFTYPPTVMPVTDLTRKIHKWLIASGTPGAEMMMGSKLLKTYEDAGLPTPQFVVEAAAGGGQGWPGYELLIQTFRSLLPVLEKYTGLDPREVDIDTLEERLRQDVVSRQAIQLMPLMFGAWSRKLG
jgi:ubiquinone/menaquinone biosynthesis C-methylase UbiE